MAIGEKLFLADKQTLDAVNANTADTRAKVGATTDTGGSATAGTLMGKLNALIVSVLTHVTNWTAARAAKIDNIDTNTTSAASNAAAASAQTAANHTASATGTLSQKLSHIINQITNVLAATAGTPKAYMSHVSLFTGTMTIINLTGKGVFYGAYAPMFVASYCNSIVVTIDGTEYRVTPMSGREYLCRSFDGGAYPLSSAAYSHASMSAPVHFKQSFKIVATFTQNSDANACRLIYDLYE